ncbi:MAG: HAD family hydrolase [Thermoplasmata archaeon]
MKGFKTALFDLDGTLIYSKGVIGRCINETLKHFGFEPFEKKKLRGLIGVPLSRALTLKTPDTKPLVDYYRKLYLSTYLDGTWVYDGMMPILAMLKDQGKKIGVVTLKQTYVAEEVLNGLNIMGFVDAVEGDDDISELKPSPSQIIRICRALDVEPGQTVMIGDTTMDINAGKNAKCKTIAVLWGAMNMELLAEAGADFLARSPSELEDLLRKL